MKVTKSNGHSYAQLVESFRDDSGQPRQRNLLTLGRVDENEGQVDKLLQSLLKARGHTPRDTSTPQVSLDNLSELSGITLPSGQPLEFILAVPGRRYGEFIELLQSLHESAAANDGETLAEAKWQGHRLVVAHEPVRAQEQTALRASCQYRL